MKKLFTPQKSNLFLNCNVQAKHQLKTPRFTPPQYNIVHNSMLRGFAVCNK